MRALYTLEELLRSTSKSKPLLSTTTCARREEWEGNGGYPAGEGMTISPGGYLVWSGDGETMMGLRPKDVLEDDWFIFQRPTTGQKI